MATFGSQVRPETPSLLKLQFKPSLQFMSYLAEITTISVKTFRSSSVRKFNVQFPSRTLMYFD